MIHSPTTLKSKWNSFKNWITPDLLYKRRPSQCSTTSTTSTNTNCSCNTQPPPPPPSQQEPVLYMKRPSLTLSIHKREEIDKLYEQYHLALDELNYAQDSLGSPYYHGDRLAAKEAIEICEMSYHQLVMFIDDDIGLKISTLKSKFNNLPLQNDDQISF